MRGLLNAEGIFALLFLGLLLFRSEARVFERSAPFWADVAFLLGIVSAAFAGYLNFPLLADDYSHIWNAHHTSARALLGHFIVPETDRFFRPAAYLSYALDAQWAGYNATAWRAGNLLIHLLNTLLVYLLLIEIGATRTPAFFGALLFGVHASRPEAVTWVAARFDLLAVLFGLGCMLLVLRGAHIALACGLLLAAILSKESAYAVPFVVAALLWYRRRPLRTVAPLIAVAAAAFAYRWWLLGGIGGYINAANGRPTVFNFSIASSLKAVFLRFWGTLLFPINWSSGFPMIGLIVAAGALCYLAWQGGERRKIVLGIGIATICSLPVHQFLSIGPDLEKSRVLYLPSIGVAILFAVGRTSRSAPDALVRPVREHGEAGRRPGGPPHGAIVFLLFQLFALETNLAVWKRIGYVADRACRVGAIALRSDPRPLAVIGLPNVLDGVYFLHTGYPECVLFQFPEAAGRIRSAPDRDTQNYTWNPATRTLTSP